MKYIRTFDQHAQYENYVNGYSDKVSPTVSYCKDTGDVHYESNKYIQIKYNVTDISTPTKIFNSENIYNEFDSISIDNVNIPLSNVEDGTYQFTETGEHIIKFYIPILTETITDRLFNNCANIVSVLIPDSNINTIGIECFMNCTNLTTVTLSQNIKDIQLRAFAFNSKLSDINLSNVVTLGESAFNTCISLSSIDISNLSGVIPESAFNSCKLQNITIPNTIISINRSAFSGNYLLTEIDIPSSITSLGINAFYQCNQLQKVTLSENIQSIGNDCFAFDNNIQTFIVKAINPPTLGDGALPGTFNASGVIKVPANSVEAYKAADNWSTYQNNIQAI